MQLVGDQASFVITSGCECHLRHDVGVKMEALTY